MFTCSGCWSCRNGDPHPDDQHGGFSPISMRTRKAGSTDPDDWVALEACVTCGHQQIQPTAKEATT